MQQSLTEFVYTARADTSLPVIVRVRRGFRRSRRSAPGRRSPISSILRWRSTGHPRRVEGPSLVNGYMKYVYAGVRSLVESEGLLAAEPVSLPLLGSFCDWRRRRGRASKCSLQFDTAACFSVVDRPSDDLSLETLQTDHPQNSHLVGA